LSAYLKHRAGGAETFHAFASRQDVTALKAFADPEGP
jgi:hypothetical protein